ncbi:MAG: sulfatase-like hydrolase/transferase [Candidatus Aminicenantia bacterium]
MSKKKRRKKKKETPQIVSAKKDSFQEIKKEGKTARKKRNKFIFYLIPIFAILIAVILFFYFFTSKNKVKRNSNLNVLLITIDTLRADRVGYSGYNIETPNLDSLAYKGARFMNAVCQVPLTLPSHASILTGTNPTYHQIKSNGPYYLGENFTTLAEILKENGYYTSAFIGAYCLDSRFGLAQGFDVYDDEYETPEYLKPHGPQRLAEDVYSSVAKWIEQNSDKKFFMWVHYWDPHGPYIPPPPFDIKYSSRPYDGEVAYTDLYVGKLINLLKEKEIYNKTLIILVGDHGEGLYDHSEPSHGVFLYDTTLRVPLIFHSPDIILKGVEINEQVRTVDILPTILDILKIDIPEFCQGVSLIPIIEGKKIREIEKSYAETYYPLITNGWSNLKSIRTNKWKYIQAPKPELYDLKNDSQEMNNLFNKNNKIAFELSEQLEKLEKRMSSGQKPTVKELTQEDKEKLIALGYISGEIPTETGSKSRPDPKDMIHILEKITKGRRAMLEGKLEEAEKILKEVMKENPENPMIHHSLGETYQKRGEWNKAIKEFKEIIRINPNEIDSYFMLAQSYYKNGMIEEAIKTSKTALNLHSGHLKSLIFLANIYKSLKDIKQSMNYLERAIKVDPSKLQLRLEYAQALTFSEEYEKAIKEYEYLLTKKPDDPMIYNNLGIIYFYLDDFEKAIKYLSKEVELHTNANSYYLLGIACGNLARYFEAVNYLEKYLTHAPLEDTSRRRKAKQALSFFRTKLK